MMDLEFDSETESQEGVLRNMNDNDDERNELGEMLEMVEYKCSICFTADSETELSVCGDQFCYGCLEEYWRVKLKDTGWGMRPVILDCPVCRVAVGDDTTWMRWVSKDVYELYIQSHTTRPQISRTCDACGHEQSLLGESLEDESLLQLWKVLEGEIPLEYRSILHQQVLDEEFDGILHHLLGQSMKNNNQSTAMRIYFLRKLLQQHSQEEEDSDSFANAQLAVLQICPGTLCDFCQGQICLRCGSSDWHEDCLEYLRQHLLNACRLKCDGECQDIRWKLQHCKYCPKCFLLITKDDDGSCNQMRCNFCRFSFCWECLREWSKDCGYYRCGTITPSHEKNLLYSTSNSNSSGVKREEKRTATPRSDMNRTEAGIPDVTRLPSFSPSS